MKLFTCPVCVHPLYFQSRLCVDCGTDAVYSPQADSFVNDGPTMCANRDTVEACNWAAAQGSAFCVSCELDTDHTPTEERLAFQSAKRRTIRQLIADGIDHRSLTPQLRFALDSSTPEARVMTGHLDGLITLDTSEADPAVREELRTELGEPYRTPLGHVRHELGHWWWATAIDNQFNTGRFREMFGDETLPYSQALADHYATPDDGSWRDHFVSHYAASHPWEDFAESFAHYLHLSDTVETAAAHGVIANTGNLPFDERYRVWVGLTVTLNDLNRSMGTPDAYPFVVPAPAIDKIAFIARSFNTPGVS